MKKIFLISLLLVTSIYALEVGEIAMLRGEALVVRNSSDIEAKIQMPIEDKDTIKTKEESKVQVKFQDETVITIGAESIFEIEEYLFEEKNSKANFNVSKGSFKVITGQIGKLAPKSFLLKTKTSLIGIRGTIFAGEIGKDNTNGDYIACIKGSIIVTSLIKKESFEINHGEMIFIGNDGSLGKPEKLNKEQFVAFSHLEKTKQSTQAPKEEVSDTKTIQNSSATQNVTANEEKTTKDEQEITLNQQNDINALIDKKATVNYKGSLNGVSKGEYKTSQSTVKLESKIQADMNMQVDFGNNDPLKLKISNQKLDITKANVDGTDITGNNLQQLNQQVTSANQFSTQMDMDKNIDPTNLKISGTHQKTANGLTTNANLDGTFKDKYASGITGTLKESTSGTANNVQIDRQIDTTFDVGRN